MNTNFINDLIDHGLGNVMDYTIDNALVDDEIYTKDINDSLLISERLINTLNEEQKALLDDYIACLMASQNRACNVAYLVGSKNTICFLSEIGALNSK